MVLLLAAVIILAAVGTACAERAPELSELYGSYEFEDTVYYNPLSSFIAVKGDMPVYTLTEDSLIIEEISGEKKTVSVTYEKAAVDEDTFKKQFMFNDTEGFAAPDISKYKTRYQYTLNEPGGGNPRYRLYMMDDELWLASLGGKENTLWSIYKLTKI
jgi:hypothetical protein